MGAAFCVEGEGAVCTEVLEFWEADAVELIEGVLLWLFLEGKHGDGLVSEFQMVCRKSILK